MPSEVYCAPCGMDRWPAVARIADAGVKVPVCRMHLGMYLNGSETASAVLLEQWRRLA